jgi:hypothetical protein
MSARKKPLMKPRGRPASPEQMARVRAAKARPGTQAPRDVPSARVGTATPVNENTLRGRTAASGGDLDDELMPGGTTPASLSPQPPPGGVFDFLGSLLWLDGTSLLEQVEPYRREIFRQAFDSWERDERDVLRRLFNLILAGRGKKNAKTLDLCLAALYDLLSPPGARGRTGYLFASDEDQAGDDLDLVKKLIAANPRTLGKPLIVQKKQILRKDGRGVLEILPAQDVAGSHGKSYSFCGFDEVHTMRTWALLEAMQLDPHRPEALMWLTSYASIYHRPGVPLFDLMKAGKTGTDPRMLFSWYGADFTTDPAFADADPETRANPSRASWADQRYLEQQKARLPAHQFRRLHLNLPGLPEGAAFTAEMVMDAVNRGVFTRPPVDGLTYHAFVDHSHGSNDDATLAVGHVEGERLVLDVCLSQGTPAPFSMFAVIPRFAALLHTYHVRTVVGDAVGGETYRQVWRDEGVSYRVSAKSTSELYEHLEPLLNHRRVDLLDVPALESQLLGLVWRGPKITHEANEHDDYATSAAGCVTLLAGLGQGFTPFTFGWTRTTDGQMRVHSTRGQPMSRVPDDYRRHLIRCQDPRVCDHHPAHAADPNTLLPPAPPSRIRPQDWRQAHPHERPGE